MYLSFRPSGSDGKWDIVRCKVPYDGNVNLPYRYYEVEDFSSNNLPYYGGLDSDLTKDKRQNWGVN